VSSLFLCFFFSSRRRHTRSKRDWSSDVCSSDLHGGEGETSIMMAIRPDLVDLDEAVCQMPHDMIRLSKHSLVMFDISELTNTGAIGDPTKATVEKGEKMLEIVVDYVVELIRDLEKNDWAYDYRK